MFFLWEQTVFGLIAAITWGAADFSGGIATKRTSAYSVVLVAHTISMVLLFVTAIALHDPLPNMESWFWGGAAGLGGGFGLLMLYKALADGKMAVAAPVSAIVAAGIPVIFSGFRFGLPGPLVVFGFFLALWAIWLLSGSDIHNFQYADLVLPTLAGVAFGFFFLCLHQASISSLLYPLVAVRIISITSLGIYSIITHRQIIPTKNSILPIIWSGVLDTVGNGAFAYAAQLGRVDIASVLGSLYPGTTVLLAWVILREQMNRKQLFGLFISLLAILAITV